MLRVIIKYYIFNIIGLADTREGTRKSDINPKL